MLHHLCTTVPFIIATKKAPEKGAFKNIRSIIKAIYTADYLQITGCLEH